MGGPLIEIGACFGPAVFRGGGQAASGCGCPVPLDPLLPMISQYPPPRPSKNDDQSPESDGIGTSPVFSGRTDIGTDCDLKSE